MKRNILRSCFLLFTLCTAISANAVTSFSGKAGAKADSQSTPESNHFDPEVKIQGYYSGQFDFSNNLTFRAEFSIRTADVLENGIAEDTEATFKIDELSLTKQFLLGSFSNYISFFTGTYEPIGSDIFLRRHFGIEEIDSTLTKSWQGLKGSTLLPFYGVGGSYILQADTIPVAGGTFIYVNHRNTNENELNMDLRFAGAFNNFCFDLAGGFGAPLKSSETNAKNEENFLTVDELFIHAGTEFFIGNKYSGGLFGEIGVKDLKFTRGKNSANIDFSSDNLYLLIEPRFVEKYYKLNISFYSLPMEAVENLFFIDSTLGFDINLMNDMMHIKSNVVTLGSHFTASWSRTSIQNLECIIKTEQDEEFEYPDFKVSPYIMINTKDTIIQGMIQIFTSRMNENIRNALRMNVSYQKFL